ncbi:MAG: hypothetical protein ACPGDB_00760, partial [Fusobacterium sp.]
LKDSFDLSKLFMEYEKKVIRNAKKPVKLALRGMVRNMFNLLKGMLRNLVFNIKSTYSIVNDMKVQN